ncbi:MAG: GNAT family N-acetyltransferase [Bacteroidetes bacterium]|nr:GNAT family N-acetyltransferase [Bacteroidota bacterium]
MIEVREITTYSDIKKYIFYPESLYKTYTHWVPPIYADEFAFHNPKKNSPLEYAETIRLMVYKNGKAEGRIMGIINRKYNDQLNEKTARFFNLDCANDPEIAHALLEKIELWARLNGMEKIIGPYGFSDKDPQGLQIEGFEYLPVIATPTNPPYLQKLVESRGYEKELDCVSYSMPIPKNIPPILSRISERVLNNKNIKLIEFTSKAKLRPYIIPVFRLVNECYAPLFGFVPMTETEMKKFAAQYLPILNPAFVKIITDSTNEVIAFVVSMPDMSKGIQRARGRLFPFGFIHILRSAKRTKQLDLLLGAVKPTYRGKGLTALLGKSLMQTAAAHNLETMDSHLILESNKRMRAECENVGGKIYKRYRVYKKML